jgi:hypothetical protein
MVIIIRKIMENSFQKMRILALFIFNIYITNCVFGQPWTSINSDLPIGYHYKMDNSGCVEFIKPILSEGDELWSKLKNTGSPVSFKMPENEYVISKFSLMWASNSSIKEKPKVKILINNKTTKDISKVYENLNTIGNYFNSIFLTGKFDYSADITTPDLTKPDLILNILYKTTDFTGGIYRYNTSTGIPSIDIADDHINHFSTYIHEFSHFLFETDNHFLHDKGNYNGDYLPFKKWKELYNGNLWDDCVDVKDLDSIHLLSHTLRSPFPVLSIQQYTMTRYLKLAYTTLKIEGILTDEEREEIKLKINGDTLKYYLECRKCNLKTSATSSIKKYKISQIDAFFVNYKKTLQDKYRTNAELLYNFEMENGNRPTDKEKYIKEYVDEEIKIIDNKVRTLKQYINIKKSQANSSPKDFPLIERN